MIVAAQPKQFTLKEDGNVYFQPDSTNPLPGDVLASIHKGESLLQPVVKLVEGRDFGSESTTDVLAAVETWVKAHIYTMLEPLFSLVGDETLSEPNKEIALKLFAHTGIVPRGEVEDQIAKLDADMRKVLRDKKVRLGPLLIFLPDLNKPAAVKLRAILWSLFNDKPLPAPIPRDGAMSSVVDVTTANPDFYRAIGYPLYGPRVIRIDMLDRVINAVYDTAKEGKFQAQHKMAEWMGCPIADLYAILSAMGHKQLEKPAEEKNVEAVVAEIVVEPVSEVTATPATNLLDIMESPVVVSEQVPADTKKPEQKKPELDWFLLRRGKAHVAQTERAPRTERAERPERREFTKPDKPAFPAERYAPKGQKFDKKKSSEDGERFNKKKHDGKKREEKFAPPNPRMYSAEAAESDNPFSVLQSLKLK
jgi:ATP-dependent RNA helicase SUPV3L1/SUV3